MVDQPWWVGAVGYQVYPRSFCDSNGDGVGDLEGIRQRLPYLSWLGIDAAWISPFFPSPGFDHGYDVSDYKGVSELHGSIKDFEGLVADATDLGLRLLVDLVPNHSSTFHPWFREAAKTRDNPFRNYYIWKDPGPDGGPPNNWVSHFGGSAWTYDETTAQYYLHLFLPEQADFNWDNERVREEFDEILRFWCELGVSGFRIDVASGLVKDRQFRDNPMRRPAADPNDPRAVFRSYDHVYDMDQDETIDIYRRWNQVVKPYGGILIGEVGAEDPKRIARYVASGDALNTAFYLKAARSTWHPAALLEQLKAVHEQAPDGISWVIDNHDSSRSATRYGGDPVAQRRSLAVTTLLMGLGGVPFLYQGEELGLVDGKVDPADLADPIATRNRLSEESGRDTWGVIGRDGARTAMPWDASHQNGFTAAPEAWLRAAPRDLAETVAGQRDVAGSLLTRYRELLAVRKTMPDLWDGTAMWLPTGSAEAALVVRRNAAVVANLSNEALEITLPDGQWEVAFVSTADAAVIEGASVAVTSSASGLLRRTADPS